MSWSELERLVEQAECDAGLRRALMHCRSRSELVLASRRLGFGIDGQDIRLARQLDETRDDRSARVMGQIKAMRRPSLDSCG